MSEQAESFPIEIRELTDLLQVQLKPDEQQEFLSQHGHVAGLMKKLKTNPQTGLSNENKQDLLNRATQFGKNEIPAKPPKSFFYVMWEAVQDTTLIILICSAFFSLILSFFHFEETRDLGEEYIKRSKFDLVFCLWEAFFLDLLDNKLAFIDDECFIQNVYNFYWKIYSSAVRLHHIKKSKNLTK